MNFSIILLSNNITSITSFLKFFSKNFKKSSLLNIQVEKYQILKFKRSKVTVLKSPHVNKKAKEAFQFNTVKVKITFFSNNFKKDLLFLKKVNTLLFFDIKMKINILGSTKSYYKGLKLNPNNYLNTKSPLTIFDLFGEQSFLLKVI
jgi:ribosomal protein S10